MFGNRYGFNDDLFDEFRRMERELAFNPRARLGV